ncbi:hypothetical protein ACQPZF_34525 [Actinosynnema sp. CS-041913]|uniref:hypothetical protein n=1 Tax=Actinosynnema sp. CS-041913 TaxID=3239917 RepID=UPI003D8CA881
MSVIPCTLVDSSTPNRSACCAPTRSPTMVTYSSRARSPARVAAWITAGSPVGEANILRAGLRPHYPKTTTA